MKEDYRPGDKVVSTEFIYCPRCAISKLCRSPAIYTITNIRIDKFDITTATLRCNACNSSLNAMCLYAGNTTFYTKKFCIVEL